MMAFNDEINADEEFVEMPLDFMESNEINLDSNVDISYLFKKEYEYEYELFLDVGTSKCIGSDSMSSFTGRNKESRNEMLNKDSKNIEKNNFDDETSKLIEMESSSQNFVWAIVDNDVSNLNNDTHVPSEKILENKNTVSVPFYSYEFVDNKDQCDLLLINKSITSDSYAACDLVDKSKHDDIKKFSNVENKCVEVNDPNEDVQLLSTNCISYSLVHDVENRTELSVRSSSENKDTNEGTYVRYLPNILRSSNSRVSTLSDRIRSKSNKISLLSESENSSHNGNTTLDTTISEEECERYVKKIHNQRKQVYNPFDIRQDIPYWIDITKDDDIQEKEDCTLNNLIRMEKSNSQEMLKYKGESKGKQSRKRKYSCFGKGKRKRRNITSMLTVDTFDDTNGISDPSMVSVLHYENKDLDDSMEYIKCNASYEINSEHETYNDEYFDKANNYIYDIDDCNVDAFDVMEHTNERYHKFHEYEIVEEKENEWNGSWNDIQYNGSDCILMDSPYFEDYALCYISDYDLISEEYSLKKYICYDDYSTGLHSTCESTMNDSELTCSNNDEAVIESLNSTIIDKSPQDQSYLYFINNDNISKISYSPPSGRKSNIDLLIEDSDKSTLNDILYSNYIHLFEQSESVFSTEANSSELSDASENKNKDTKSQVDIQEDDCLFQQLESKDNEDNVKNTISTMYANLSNLSADEFNLQLHSCDNQYERKALKESSAPIKQNNQIIANDLTNIKKLQCAICYLSFASQRTLALHLAGAHRGMYIILCERCGRLFNKKYVFNRHLVNCGCTLPFKCNKCNKTYRHKSSLLYHVKTTHEFSNMHNSPQVYTCTTCLKVYKTYISFEKHINSHISLQ